MSNQDCSRSEVLYALKEIEKEVIRVLGKYQKNIITIANIISTTVPKCSPIFTHHSSKYLNYIIFT